MCYDMMGFVVFFYVYWWLFVLFENYYYYFGDNIFLMKDKKKNKVLKFCFGYGGYGEGGDLVLECVILEGVVEMLFL